MTTTQDHLNKQILDLTADWENNRLLYPGWLIAPERSRSPLEEFTKNWWQSVVKVAPNLGIADALRALFELNWRLETSLLPLWTDIAEATETVLEKISPFPEFLDNPNATLRLDNLNRDAFPWATIRNQWIRLALAVLRFHREERHRLDFEKGRCRLEPILQYDPENSARVSYEKCLFHLGCSDEESVRAALKSWPQEQQDPIWMARKAAVLIEIGEIQEATPLAENALQSVRSRGKGSDDLATMSREGWIMLLVYGLENHRWFSGQGPEPDHRGRWEYLARFRCDPWAELGFFDEKLKHIPQAKTSNVTVTQGFQPRTARRSYHLGGSNGPDLTSAYQLMRLAEEAACPPYFSHTTFIGTKLEKLADLFSDRDPVRTHTLLCRLDSTEVVERYLSRYRVAALSSDILNELKDVALGKINQNEKRATGSERHPQDTPTARLARKRLETGLELLARLVIRLSSTEADHFLTRAIELFRSEPVKVSWSLPKRLKNLFESLLLTMDPEGIVNRLFDLMSLPIPGTADLPVEFPNDWPNVFDLLPNVALGKVKHKVPGWSQQIARLIGILSDTSVQNRGGVAFRLHHLNDHGLLNRTEIRQFSKALWKIRTPDFDLPIVRPYRQILVLRLPQPTAGIAQQRMQAFLRSGDILRVRTHFTGPDGKDVSSYKQFVDQDEFLLSWLHTTPTTPKREKQYAMIRLTWGLTDILELFRKIKTWLDDEGRFMLSSIPISAMSENMVQEPLRERTKIILDVLRDVIIARISSTHRVAKEAVALVTELTSLGAATQSIRPALLKFRSVDVSSTTSSLHRGLAATDVHVYYQSVRGLLFWLRSQEKGVNRLLGYDLPPPPRGLINQLGCNLASRRQPGLFVTLDTIGTLLVDCPTSVQPEFLELIQVGLEAIHAESQYRVIPDEVGPIPFNEVPEYRRRIARLLYHLLAFVPEPSRALVTMKDAYLNDPLPEVRAAFQSESE